MKLGLDLHGVIDAKPAVFAVLTKLLVEAGHEVHILTGPPVNDELRSQLDSFGVVWTHLFSIVDQLKSEGVHMWQDEKGHWWSEKYFWDKAKGEYCAKHQIDLHFDDSDQYNYFFTTPYARFFSRDSHRVKKTAVPQKVY
jgi:hypothetical protein